MDRLALPALFALLAWWAGTGVILWLNRLPPWTRAWSMGGATLVALAALAGLRISSAVDTVPSAYCSFACAILVWAWQEIGFLLGYVTGPRRTPATPAITGWPRVSEAFRTVAHHELALLVLVAAVTIVSWGQPNPVGWWTIAVLWVMRQSAKLNLFLGVRNLYEEFLPVHLKYLHSYFRRQAMNPLFPLSVVLPMGVLVPMWTGAAEAPTAFSAAALSLVAALLTLAVAEHWFLVLPLPSHNLWRWAWKGRAD